MHKWLKSCLPDKKTIINSSCLSGIKTYLKNPNLWSMKCNSVAIGVAVGIFAAIIPIGQMLIAAILAILLRGNLPIAVLTTWISNPFTFIPITYFVYFIGKIIIKSGENAVFYSFNWEFHSLSQAWDSLLTWSLQFGKAFFVGLPIVALTAAAAGYLLVFLIWSILYLIKNKNKK